MPAQKAKLRKADAASAKDQSKTAHKKGAAAATTISRTSTGVSSWVTLKLIASLLAFALRFWHIDHPDSVVFDEVHFGKFSSHYLQREYYFDLHPPLAKLMFAAVGWLIGYDGSFKFENIGEDYIINRVPYVAYRSLAASLGAGTVPLVFGTLEYCGFSPIACFFGAALVIFDTAQIAQTRLILLDAALVFFMMVAVYSYVRFRQQRHAPFSVKWWLWLLLTGFGLSCTISTKYVGLFSFLMIGVAVIADLWNLLDVRGKPPSQQLSLFKVAQHFVARFVALIAIPLALYLWWFYVHFAVLTYSGPGDSHMTPEFQATLKANPLTRDALDIYFYDVLTIKSQPSGTFLHSHTDRYPLQYEDGRISSQGQQVTCYDTEDPNNLWQILPTVDLPPEEQSKNLVVGSQQIMLRHVATDSFLLTHDVASPGFPTNEEFTTVPRELAYGDRHADAIFTLDVIGGGDVVRTLLTQFRLKHVTTSVAMWLSNKFLPDWGFNQREVNGNKNLAAPGTVWSFGSIAGLDEPEAIAQRKSIGDGNTTPRRSFWTDYAELQLSMFRSNNQLTVEHPYMSLPWEWPLLTRGISFWTDKETQSQIYLVGNYAGWYLELVAIVLFVALFAFNQLAVLREYDWLSGYATQKLNSTLLWLFLGWAFHYLPFYLMGRQLFLHHYLPAQVIAAMLTAGVIDFVLGQNDSPEAKYHVRRSSYIVFGIVLAAVIGTFVYLAPLAYGLPLTTEQIQAREWLNTQLHFNK